MKQCTIVAYVEEEGLSRQCCDFTGAMNR